LKYMIAGIASPRERDAIRANKLGMLCRKQSLTARGAIAKSHKANTAFEASAGHDWNPTPRPPIMPRNVKTK
jgi:hypothetical protein